MWIRDTLEAPVAGSGLNPSGANLDSLIRVGNQHRFLQGRFARRTALFGSLDYCFSGVVANGEVSSVSDEQWNGVFIDVSEDWRFTIVITGVHIRTKTQELLFDVSQENLVQGCIAILVTGIHVGAGFLQEAHDFHARALLVMIAGLPGEENGCSSLAVTHLEFG